LSLPESPESLLLSFAGGDQDAFGAFRDRIVGLVLVNVRRVLHDVSWSEAVTEEIFFAGVRREASAFDPAQDNALIWVLSRAHQRTMEISREGRHP